MIKDDPGYYNLVLMVLAIISIGYNSIILTKVIAEIWEHIATTDGQETQG